MKTQSFTTIVYGSLLYFREKNILGFKLAIETEFKDIQTQHPQRWQNFLSLKRLWNGGKKAGIKISESVNTFLKIMSGQKAGSLF
jgi:hypothetical protein